jgi:hypothetical protein
MSRSYEKLYGSLHEIPNEKLWEFLEENESRDTAFLAIVCSEVLRRSVAGRGWKYKDPVE